jgi:acyl CoA:acetate/3-ketoacid CoA transferase alpha subunit
MNVLESGVGELFQPVDLTAFREWNRRKSRSLVDKRMSEQEAVRRFLKPGMYIGTELYGSVRCPMSLVREILRQNVTDLRVAGQGVLELDLLLAAHLVKALDLTYVGLECTAFPDACDGKENGMIKVTDWSNASIGAFQGGCHGVPFLPARSMLGTDTFKYSALR